jgi:hypothetical protein
MALIAIVPLQPSIRGQQIDQPPQAARQRDLPRWTIGSRFPAAQLRQQLYALLLLAHPQCIHKSCRHPRQRHQRPYPFQVEQLHFFPAQAVFGEWEAVFHTPALTIDLKHPQRLGFAAHLPIGQQQPRLQRRRKRRHFQQPHGWRELRSVPDPAHIRRLGQLDRPSSDLDADSLAFRLPLALFAHRQHRLELRQHGHRLARSRDAPRLPAASPIRQADQALGMRQADKQLVVLLPNRAPNRDIIEATIEQPGDRPAGLERGNRLTDCLECGLDFTRLRNKIRRGAAEEPMVQHATVQGGQAQHRQRPISGNERFIERTDFHQVGHLGGVGLAQIRAIGQQPEFVAGRLGQLRDGLGAQLSGQVGGVTVG